MYKVFDLQKVESVVVKSSNLEMYERPFEQRMKANNFTKVVIFCIPSENFKFDEDKALSQDS